MISGMVPQEHQWMTGEFHQFRRRERAVKIANRLENLLAEFESEAFFDHVRVTQA